LKQFEIKRRIQNLVGYQVVGIPQEGNQLKIASTERG